MNINLSKLSDKEIAHLCIKHDIIETSILRNCTRKQVITEIEKWCLSKKEKYKSRPRAMSDPNIRSVKVIETNNNKSVGRQRRNSAPQQTFVKSHTSPPKPNLNNRGRRMSEPLTPQEKTYARDDHQMKQQYNKSQEQLQQELTQQNMSKYDSFGIYPGVKRLIAIGDLHGDLRVTLIALKLAGVISKDIFPYNVQNIQWTGGSTWVIQLGDQIDRCRPDNWVKNCIEDYSDVVEDEGNNMMIIQIFQKLDAQAKKVGGRVLGMIGNHELMNIDRDFRYVSPQEFLEFVPPNERGIKKTEDGYPYGYYHRLKVFERGGNIAKHYALQKKSITIIGKNLFIHGGLSHDLASKYSIHEINEVVKKWLLKKSSEKEDEIFEEIFRDDDDMSPFWCRLYSEDDGYGENTLEGFNRLLEILNKRNQKLQPIERMIVAHTPQFMNDMYMNSLYNERLWRIDVGMSRAFGKQDNCGENKYRQIQVLEILNDTVCNKLLAPYHGRQPSEGMGQNASLENASFL
tara:strand:- start:55 stop:1599 length:1545 start_codon:yes stop_codon:yes gene_type:complete